MHRTLFHVIGSFEFKVMLDLVAKYMKKTNKCSLVLHCQLKFPTLIIVFYHILECQYLTCSWLDLDVTSFNGTALQSTRRNHQFFIWLRKNYKIIKIITEKKYILFAHQIQEFLNKMCYNLLSYFVSTYDIWYSK